MLISPAKSLQFDKQLPTTVQTQPQFSLEAEKINSLLKKKSPKKLGELMHSIQLMQDLLYLPLMEMFIKDWMPLH